MQRIRKGIAYRTYTCKVVNLIRAHPFDELMTAHLIDEVQSFYLHLWMPQQTGF